MTSYEGFEIKDVVHRGARSTVLRAVRRADDQPVVLKHPTTDVPSASTLRRLRYELDVGARLGARSGLPYLGEHRFGTSAAIVMEDLGAVDLERRYGGARMPLREWLVLARKIALALADLHALGFVHGDVKPANVLFDEDDAPTLGDFGLARPIGSPATPGTPGYVSAARAGGALASPRDDVHGVGCIARDLLEAGQTDPVLTKVRDLALAEDEAPPDAAALLDALGWRTLSPR